MRKNRTHICLYQSSSIPICTACKNKQSNRPKGTKQIRIARTTPGPAATRDTDEKISIQKGIVKNVIDWFVTTFHATAASAFRIGKTRCDEPWLPPGVLNLPGLTASPPIVGASRERRAGLNFRHGREWSAQRANV